MNKIEIFKKYFWNLIHEGEYEKADSFKNFLKEYFSRKGQKTEYVYIVHPLVKSINQITDEMLDSIE